MQNRFWKWILGGILFGGMLILTGCDSTRLASDLKNIEERDYATILVIGDAGEADYDFTLGIAKPKRVGEDSSVEKVCHFAAKDLTQLGKAYQDQKGKDLSLSHLKVICLATEEQDILDPYLRTLLLELERDPDVSKTCPVLRVRDAEALVESLEREKNPFARYIEGLIRVREKEGADIPWIKDYVKGIREGTRFTVWYLQKGEEGYYLSDERDTFPEHE